MIIIICEVLSTSAFQEQKRGLKKAGVFLRKKTKTSRSRIYSEVAIALDEMAKREINSIFTENIY